MYLYIVKGWRWFVLIDFDNPKFCRRVFPRTTTTRHTHHRRGGQSWVVCSRRVDYPRKIVRLRLGFCSSRSSRISVRNGTSPWWELSAFSFWGVHLPEQVFYGKLQIWVVLAGDCQMAGTTEKRTMTHTPPPQLNALARSKIYRYIKILWER